VLERDAEQVADERQAVARVLDEVGAEPDLVPLARIAAAERPADPAPITTTSVVTSPGGR
jgi:hypothetical protein